jgi:hypothetical protein
LTWSYRRRLRRFDPALHLTTGAVAAVDGSGAR